MPKQLNVNLAFTADTVQAKRQIQDLQQTLQKLSSSTIKNNIGKEMNEELRKSVVSANQLKDMLQQAVNPKTGNLDLSRFSEQLKASGRDIQSYAQDLNNLGPNGTKAFMQLAQSIASAEVPMRRTNALAKEFGTTLMNAARWQFSSSVLHGFMGAIQGAYGYAQDLDKSLNNIRIVTGLSADQMAIFADEANKSAQALSASTLAYTDAALIYYQQGIRDQDEIRQRVDTTIKLSNVTGQSAENVSSYMTAIWNNFYDGSQSLESFADKITALGAATASSSEEIAKGLQQFAALGSSLGLNYDDATAALATVVAQTRQSASTVGNSFKTLFQRIESLKLGDTLEDGVDLTKYSEALNKVGVQILDVQGNMRDMHDVIQDLGAAWQGLSKAQQNALAQTVGGVRNSNTLIAWMDNFDKFQQNLGVAQGAEGELERQAEIYAESWEAAQKRVKAAWQAIYQDLIDDKFFISILKTFEKILSGIDSLIDGMGGLKGVLGIVGALITTVFADGLAKGIQNAVYNFKVFTGQAAQEADALAIKFKNVADQMGQDLQSPTATAEVTVLKDQIDFALKLRQAGDSITESNKTQLLSLNEITKEYGEAYIAAVKLKEAAEERRADAAREARDYVASLGDTKQEKVKNRAEVGKAISSEHLDELEANFERQQAILNKQVFSMEQLKDFGTGGMIQSLRDLKAECSDVIDQSSELNKAFESTEAILADSSKSDEEKVAALNDLNEKIKEVANNSDLVKDHLSDAMDIAAKAIAGTGEEARQLAQKMKDAVAAHFELRDATEQTDNAQNNYNARLKEAELEFENLKGKVSDYSTQIVTCARGMSQLWAAFNSFSKILDTLNDKDLTWADKLKAIIPSLLTGLPMLISGLQTLSKGKVFASIGEGITVGMAAFKTGTGVIGAFGAGISKVMALLGPFALKIGIVVGAIWLLVKAFQAWKGSTPEGQLEEANRRLDEAKTKAQEASDAYNELTTTLDEYRQVKEDINNIEDSDERKRAISEENEKILELLHNTENWQDLIGDLKYDDNGLISLTEEQLKALENDKAREESLAKQLKLQEQINANIANEAVQDSNYSGKKIVAKVETTGGADNNIKQYQNQDITAEIADFLLGKGLNVRSDDDVIRDALENSGKYNESQIDQIIAGINAIEGDQASLKQFEEMQANHLQTMAENDALEKQQNQLNIDQAQNEMGDKVSISDLSRFDDVQTRIAEEWNALDQETKDAVLRSNDINAALQRAFGDRLNIEEANNEALKQEQAERQAWREQNVNSMSDKMTGIEEAGGNKDYIKTQLNQLSDEDLKIAATLELDKYKSISELKAAIEELKQQTEDDRKFELEMKTAQEAGLDIDEWNKYVEYLQKTNEELANNKVLAAEVATANMRLNRGVKSLVDDFDDWKKIIKTANEEGNKWAKNNLDYAESMQGIQKALADISNVDISVIEDLGQKFVTDNLDLIQEAAYGDVDAIDELIKKVAEANLMKLEIPTGIDTETFDADRQALIDAIYDTNLNEIEIGSFLETADFYKALEQMVADGAITADQINGILSQIGYTPVVEYLEGTLENYAHDEGSATGSITYVDSETDERRTMEVEHNDAFNNLAVNAAFKVPIIKGTNGGPAQFASASNMAKALASSTFTGGTGAQTSATNRNKGAANRPKSTGGSKGGKGKSGGSGSDKKKEEKELKELERAKEEEDRYHNLNEAVDDLNTTLDRLDKNKDRAWGKSKINFMNLEIKKTKEQIALTKQYIAEIQRYAKIDKEALEQVLSSIGMSASEIANQFDTDGVLKDYEALFKRIQDSFNNTALKTYNNAIEAFNNASIAYNNSAQSDADKEAYENAEKTLKEAEKIYKTQEETYKEQMDALKQYEDTINLLQDKEQELIDQLNDLYDKQLELVKEKVDIHVSLNEDDLKLLEWHLKHLGDSLDHVADRIVNLNKQMDANADDIYRWQKGLEDIFANHGVNIDLSQYDNGADLLAALEKGTNDLTGIFTKEEIDTIRDYRDKLMETYDAMRDLTDQVTENVIKAYDDWNDKLDEQIEKFEKYKDLIAIWKDIVELTGKNRLGMSDEDILDFQQKMVDNAQNAAEAAKNIADAHREEVERLRQILANEDLTEYERAEYEKMLEVEEEYLEAAEKQALEKFKEALQEAEELFNQTLEANANAYKKMMSGGVGSLDLLQEQFNRQKKLNHLYLDNYEKYKKLGDIIAQINKNLNDSSNIKVQEKLNTLLDEVNLKMTESFQISEGEAEILARRVALLQAEMQLEDARNAKSAVRMTRDNEGNFSYTYTADQDAISEAQQNYADKFYDLLDYERKLQEDMQDQMIQTMAEFVERRNDIWNDTLLTDAERDAALQRLEEDYTKMMNFYADQLGMTMDEMMRLRDDDWLDYEDILNRKLASQDDFITEFENTLLGTVVPGWEEIKDVMESWQTSSQDLYDKDSAAFKHWQEENSYTWELAGYDVNKGAAQVQAALDGIEKESGEATEATIKMAEEMNKAMDGIIDKAGVFYQTWANYMENAVKKIDKMSTALNELLRLLGEVDDANSGNNDKPSTSSSSSSTPAPTPTPAPSSSGSKGKLTIGTTATYTGGLYYTTSYGGGTGNRGPGKKVKVTYMNPGAPYPIHVESTDSAYGWLREDQLTGYDTGGFTGKWGRDGKLAVLHEKELVLNKEDTSNILSVVDMVRQITSTLGAQGNYLSNSISNFSNVLSGEYGQQQLQQQVHIDASFPNVQSHSEIELALNNLINSASQYVNRK